MPLSIRIYDYTPGAKRKKKNIIIANLLFATRYGRRIHMTGPRRMSIEQPARPPAPWS